MGIHRVLEDMKEHKLNSGIPNEEKISLNGEDELLLEFKGKEAAAVGNAWCCSCICVLMITILLGLKLTVAYNMPVFVFFWPLFLMACFCGSIAYLSLFCFPSEDVDEENPIGNPLVDEEANSPARTSPDAAPVSVSDIETEKLETEAPVEEPAVVSPDPSDVEAPAPEPPAAPASDDLD